MKTHNVAILLDDTITTIKVKFVGKHSPTESNYTFLCKKELANTLGKDDMVVVNTINGFAVVRVEEVHEEADIDLDSRYNYQWAFQKVNVVVFEQLDALLNDAEKHIKSMQRQALRNQIKQHIEQGKLFEGASRAICEENEDD